MFAVIHAWTGFGGLVPGVYVSQIAAPEGKIAALGGADFVDGAAVIEKDAVAVGEIVARREGVAVRAHELRDERLA